MSLALRVSEAHAVYAVVVLEHKHRHGISAEIRNSSLKQAVNSVEITGDTKAISNVAHWTVVVATSRDSDLVAFVPE